MPVPVLIPDSNGTLFLQALNTAFDETIQHIGTIAALRTTTPTSSSMIIAVTGYYTALDNIGVRPYYWDATSTETDNGGTIIQVTGVVTGRWKMKYSGAVNVKWFGAKGDGITDNTLIYTSIINALPSGTTIEWTNETYVGSFLSDKSFKLKGNGANLISSPTSLFAIKFSGSISSYSALSVAPAYGDLSLSGTSGLADKDLLILYSGTVRPSDSQAVNYEIVEVKADGSLYGMVYSNQNGGSPTYAKITPLSGIIVDNFNIDGGVANVYGVYLQYSKDSNISNIKMTGSSATTISMNYVYNCDINNIIRIMPSATGSGQGYNVAYYCAKHCNTFIVYGEQCRHDYDQDSAYVMNITNVASIDCISAPVQLAHNSFAGYTNIENCNIINCKEYAIGTSSGGVSTANLANTKNIIIDNITITTSIVLNTAVTFNAIYFQVCSEDCKVSNIYLKNTSGTTFDYKNGAYNSSYNCIRAYSPINAITFYNINCDSANRVIYIDRLGEFALNSTVNIDTVNVKRCTNIVSVSPLNSNYSDLKMININFFESSTVYGQSLVYINSTTLYLRQMTISKLSIIPIYYKVVITAGVKVVPPYSYIDNVGMSKGASLNTLAADGTITQEMYLTRDNFAIWGSTSKTLSASLPIDYPITKGNTFGILNYGAGTLTIPTSTNAATCSVYGTVPLLIEPTYFYEFSANTAGQWNLIKKQSGMTLT